MVKSTRIAALFLIVFSLSAESAINPKASAQSERTLAGEWIVTSSPINGEVTSPRGNTLGFPERDMVFEQDGELRIGTVLREDAGPNVRPLGVWRLNGNSFSTTFQLWCPNSSGPCGSIVMRGEFVRDDRIRGTMTAFFDVPDPNSPTGFDMWTFSFRGDRVVVGSEDGAN
ncbi:MAG TPA: hypothetical protein VLE20_06730 [Blastocatellia bacterium]|nr:hypothetical protein [Blastocatellia bacterium]